MKGSFFLFLYIAVVVTILSTLLLSSCAVPEGTVPLPKVETHTVEQVYFVGNGHVCYTYAADLECLPIEGISVT